MVERDSAQTRKCGMGRGRQGEGERERYKCVSFGRGNACVLSIALHEKRVNTINEKRVHACVLSIALHEKRVHVFLHSTFRVNVGVLGTFRQSD